MERPVCMKKLLAIVMIVFGGFRMTIGQETTKSCPTIELTGPPGIVLPGQTAVYTVAVRGVEKTDALEFNWTVSAGQIKEGQGTTSIKVLQPDACLVVTVEVKGLPASCPSGTSEGGICDLFLVPRRIGSITTSTYSIDKHLLQQVGAALRDTPASQLYVQVYYGMDEDKFPKISSRILRQLSATKIDPARFTIAGSHLKERGAIFWLIPPGAEYPAP